MVAGREEQMAGENKGVKVSSMGLSWMLMVVCRCRIVGEREPGTRETSLENNGTNDWSPNGKYTRVHTGSGNSSGTRTVDRTVSVWVKRVFEGVLIDSCRCGWLVIWWQGSGMCRSWWLMDRWQYAPLWKAWPRAIQHPVGGGALWRPQGTRRPDRRPPGRRLFRDPRWSRELWEPQRSRGLGRPWRVRGLGRPRRVRGLGRPRRVRGLGRPRRVRDLGGYGRAEVSGGHGGTASEAVAPAPPLWLEPYYPPKKNP